MTLCELQKEIESGKFDLGDVQIAYNEKCSAPGILGIYEENGTWNVYRTSSSGYLRILGKGNEKEMVQLLYRTILQMEKLYVKG